METKRYNRWYDDNKELQKVIYVLEQLPTEIKLNVSMDIIQLILQENLTNPKELMDFANKNNTGQNSRWYDFHEITQQAIEMLQLINKRETQIILPEIVQTIMYFATEYRPKLPNNLVAQS